MLKDPKKSPARDAIKSASRELEGVRAQIRRYIDRMGQTDLVEFKPDFFQKAHELKSRASALELEIAQNRAVMRASEEGPLSEGEVIRVLEDFTSRVHLLSGADQKALVHALIKDVTIFRAKPTCREVYRVVVRLAAEYIRSGTSRAAVPIQFKIEVVSRRNGGAFRFLEPIESEVECPGAESDSTGEISEIEKQTLSSHPLITALRWKTEIEAGKTTQKAIALTIGKKPALVCTYLRLLKLPSGIIASLTARPNASILAHFTLRKLLKLVRLPTKDLNVVFQDEMKAARKASQRDPTGN